MTCNLTPALGLQTHTHIAVEGSKITGLSVSFSNHPYIPYFLIQRNCLFLVTIIIAEFIARHTSVARMFHATRLLISRPLSGAAIISEELNTKNSALNDIARK